MNYYLSNPFFNVDSMGPYILRLKSEVLRPFFHKKECKVDPKVTHLEKTIAEMQKRIEELEESKESKSFPTTISTNNTTTTSNSHNKYHNCGNVTINAFQDTQIRADMHKLSQLLQKTGSVVSAVMQLIKEHHFNTEHPEDMNVYISNLKDNVGKCFDGESWCTVRATDLAQDVFGRFRDHLDDTVNEEIYSNDEDDGATTTQNNGRYSGSVDMWTTRTSRTGFEERGRFETKYLLHSKADLVRKQHHLRY